ncbi:MAG: ABC transporter ATP-binding protein/permease [Clostridium sp.]|jgi:ATP-binding cassette subfamily B protein|nr:ABC transporter ATP-binding protein/permease [Clostridium sp.]
MKNKLKAAGWAFSLAWRIDKVILLTWCLLLSVVSVLPAIALAYNKKIIVALNDFISTGNGSFDAVLPIIIVFGIITALIGLSNRFNVEFIYSVMYNKYYFGMAELLMDSVQDFSMEELLKKDINDEYHAVVLREGSLTDVISGCCTLLGKFIGLSSLLIMAFTLSMPIFFISLSYIVSIIWLNLVYVEKLRYNWYKIRDNERLAGHYEGMPYSPEYAKEIRVFESKDTLIENWKDAYSAIYDYQVKNTLDIELRTFVSGFGFYLFLAIMTIYSLFSVVNGAMSATVLLVILTMCLKIFTAVSGIARTLMLTDHGIYALERQYRIFGLRQSGKKTVNSAINIAKSNDIVFETKNLSYSYKGDTLALDNVSMKIRKGETIALIGMNGSGKSTLVKLLLQLYKPLSGSLYFYGEDYEMLESDFMRNKIGAFFQDYYLFHMPISENIGFGDIENVNDDKKVNTALQKGDADGFVSLLPKGKDTFIYTSIDESGANFSGGEVQKLAISRAHMSDKDILVFDEPASMLDPTAELEQFMNIKEKVEGRTAILISHRVGFARLADRIILLDNGKVAETGTHIELMNKNGMYAKFFNEQAQWYRNTEVATDA